MLTETALLGLACLISNAPAANREAILKDLSPSEVVAVQEKEKLCVPERLKQIIVDGRAQAVQGEAGDGRTESQPTFRC